MTSSGRTHAIFKVKAGGKARIIVFDTQDLSVGRSPENDLALEDAEMSRKHAVFQRVPGGCRVQDLGTSNGTSVNGAIVDHADLAQGDVVRIGEVEITYAETTRNPAQLGAKVEYASQLKSFQSPMAGGDGEATILGLVDQLGGGGDDDLEIRPAGDFEYDLHEMDPVAGPRNLDLELESLGADPIDGADPIEDLDFESEVTTPAKAKAAPLQTQVWELEDADGKAAAGRLSLTLEIDGLGGELRSALESLTGKLIELPPLRLRIKGDDLG
jgi:predicted component of type VI protein secretion system